MIFAIFRKTYGWHKKEDWITNTQIADMTDIAEAHISRTIKILLQKNMVKKNGKKLGIQKDYEQWKKLPIGVTNHSKKKLPLGDKKLPIGVTEVTPRGIKKLPIGVYTKETKETTTKETIQKEKEVPFIEFDFELGTWHNISDNLKDIWGKKFPMLIIEEQLHRFTKLLMVKPEYYEKYVKDKYHNNFLFYIFDWLEGSKNFYLKDHPEYQEKVETINKSSPKGMSHISDVLGKFNMPIEAKGG